MLLSFQLVLLSFQLVTRKSQLVTRNSCFTILCNLIIIVTNIEKLDISSNLASDISKSIDFRLDGSISVNNDRKDDSTNSDNIDNNSKIEFCQNPLDTYRYSANGTVLVNTSCENKFVSITPGENVIPESLTNDKFCEELSHPHLFLTEKFGFQTKKKVQLSPSKYFNQRLLNYTQKFSYPDVLILSSGERSHYRKVKLVFRHHVPNKFYVLPIS